MLESAVAHSRQHSDNFYHFSNNTERITEALRNKGFTLNYVLEDFTYLEVREINSIAFPMICFCDIIDEPARLEPHKNLYGQNGIGLTKDWGKRNGIQPVHYILPESPFSQDLKLALEAAFSMTGDDTPEPTNVLRDFLITCLAYTKPLWGTNEGARYCFEDECEWRFVPSDLPSDMPRLFSNPSETQLFNFRHTLWMPQTYLLEFNYEDISDIFTAEDIVPTLFNVIDELEATNDEKKLLKSKIRED